MNSKLRAGAELTISTYVKELEDPRSVLESRQARTLGPADYYAQLRNIFKNLQISTSKSHSLISRKLKK